MRNFLIGLLAPLALVGAWSAWGRETGTVNPEARANKPRLTLSADDPSQFLEGGVEVSYEEADRELSYPVRLPNDADARRDDSTHFYVVSGEDRAAVLFSSEVVMRFDPADFDDPEKEFRALVESAPGNARYALVNDRPAFIIEPNTDDFKSNPGSLQMVVDGISIRLFAYDKSGDELIRIAESIK